MLKTIMRPILISGLLTLGLGAADAFADKYYRWTGEDGVIHYGSRPPEGVEAEEISTWGKSAGERSASPTKTKSTASKPSSKEEQQKQEIVAQRQQQCEEERARLTALQTPGRRIRMEQEDGSVRYLTPEEIASEVSKSKEFLGQGCQ